MPRKRSYRVTISELYSWDVDIEASSVQEAKEIAGEMDLTDEPDSIDLFSIEVESEDE